MERSEPSLVPEWLRTSGSGGLNHHVSSSKTDGPLLALPKRNRNLNNSGYSEAPHSSSLDRSCSTNSRRNLSSNGSSKHDKNPYARSHSGSARNQRVKDREKLGIPDIWESEYSDPLASIIGGRHEKDTLRRSQSMISRRPDEFMQRRSYNDSRNRSHNINGNGHGAISVGSSPTGTKKVSFERDFPLISTDERPATPDVTRVPSPGLSRGVQGLSIGTSPLIGCEGWTSALAEVPVVGSNNIGSSPSLPSVSCGGGVTTASTASSDTSAINGLNMAEALVQGPVRPQNVPQQPASNQRFEELPSVGFKKLIPMTSSMPKSSMLNPSDKLKPKTATRSNEGVAGLKNGLQQLPSFQLGNQATSRGGSGRPDGLGSSKLQLLKPVREKVVSPSLKDAPAQTVKVSSAVPNGPSIGSPKAASHPSKNPNNMKHSNNERKTAGYSLNGVQVVDKRSSLAQLRSRNDFFNLVRKKSMGNTSSAGADSSAVVSPVVQNSGEDKELALGAESPIENGSEVVCNGDASNLTKSFSDQGRGSDLSPHELIHPEEELDFLRALGWEDDGGDDEGLTEEEINTFVQKYMKWRPESKLCQGLQLKMLAESNSPASCPTGASSELRTADTSL